MKVMHLTSSRFFGGPERQMLGLAQALADSVETVFASFAEGGLNKQFLETTSRAGFQSIALKCDTPHLLAAMQEIRTLLRQLKIDVLICHGYKADFVGAIAARKAAVPVIAVSRGWTAENWKVRLYETLDRRMLRRMDKIVCVSNSQSAKIRRIGVPDARIVVIHNAICAERFSAPPLDAYRSRLKALFDAAPEQLVGAAGRLSPEKGFGVLIQACKELATSSPELDFGVVLFGEGTLYHRLQKQIDAAKLSSRFLLAGFTPEFDRFLPHFDLFVQTSHTEGLPNVLLEAAAAGVPVVATDVGGTREVIADAKTGDEVTGKTVPPNDPHALALGMCQLLTDRALHERIKTRAPTHIAKHFTFAAQANAYSRLLESLIDVSAKAA